jgi:phage/plasmid-associated DNA primase
MKGVRFVSTGELNANYKLRIDTIKKLSGNDRIVQRNLFEAESSYEAQFKMNLSCNTAPPCDDIDDGFARRVEMVKFPFKFTDSPNPKIPTEKLMDTSLKEKIKDSIEIRQGFMLLLIDIFKQTKGNYQLSPDMLEITKSYLTDQDKLKCFLDDTIEYSGNEKDLIMTRELCDLYMSHENIRITMHKFTPKLKKYIDVVHKKKGNCIVGYTYISRNDPDDTETDPDSEV